MSLVLASLETAIMPSRALTSFRVLRCQVGPLFHLLSLHDDQHTPVHWIIPVSLKQLARHSVLLWQLPTPGLPTSLTCLDSGAMRLAPVHPGTPTDLHADLAEGTLRLHFEGHLLRGYYRLQRLPEGSGQLWQLTPIGYL